MALSIGRTYTSPQGAIAGQRQQLAQQVSTTVSAPPPNAQPAVSDQAQPTQPPAQPTAPAAQPPTGLTGPTPYNAGGGADVQALADQRAKLIDELFNHDSQLAAQYANPSSPDYVENPDVRMSAQHGVMSANLGLLNTLNSLIGASAKKLSPTEQKQYYLDQLNQDLTTNPSASLTEAMQKYRAYLTPNDIVDTFTAYNPGGTNLSDAQSYGYKSSTAINTAQKKYLDAQKGLDFTKRVDEASKEAQTVLGMAYGIPWLAPLLENKAVAGRFKPSQYETNRTALAQELAKYLLQMGYPAGAKNLLDMIPSVADDENARASKIAYLTQTFKQAQDDANAQASGFALGPSATAMAKANTNQPPVASAPTGTTVTTSSGKQFIITSPSSSVAVEGGGL